MNELPPQRLEGPAAWLGSEMLNNPGAWLRQLQIPEIAELEAAARHRSVARATRRAV